MIRNISERICGTSFRLREALRVEEELCDGLDLTQMRRQNENVLGANHKDFIEGNKGLDQTEKSD